MWRPLGEQSQGPQQAGCQITHCLADLQVWLFAGHIGIPQGDEDRVGIPCACSLLCLQGCLRSGSIWSDFLGTVMTMVSYSHSCNL